MYIDSQIMNSVAVVDQRSSNTSQTMIEVKPTDSLIKLALVNDKSSNASSTTVEVKTSEADLGLLEPSLIDRHPFKAAPPTTDVKEISHLILNIIFEYALNKFDDSKDRLSAGAAKFLSVISRFVASRTRVEACLPAFPFKSANKVYKVLGILPDKAEELALERLNCMCTRIRDVYPPGAKVTIISDGTTYNGRFITNSIVSLADIAVS